MSTDFPPVRISRIIDGRRNDENSGPIWGVVISVRDFHSLGLIKGEAAGDRSALWKLVTRANGRVHELSLLSRILIMESCFC